MSLSKFEYISAQSMEEAANLASELGSKCIVMAGGTDVIPLLKDHVIAPEYIIDLKNIQGFDQLEYIPGKGLKVGALTKLKAIETSEVVKNEFQAVADAAHYVASTQIRCKGTMAGNICNASPSADTAAILLAMDAVVTTFSGSNGNRDIKITDFFKGVKKTSLEPGELVTEINIPELKPGEGAAYFKHAIRKAMDLAIIGVASWVKMDGKKIVDCRIAVGGAATTPFRALEAEKMLTGRNTLKSFWNKLRLP